MANINCFGVVIILLYLFGIGLFLITRIIYHGVVTVLLFLCRIF